MQFDPVEPEALSSLRLDDIYQRLHRLDVVERSITSPPEAEENDPSDMKDENDTIEALHQERSALRNQAMVLSRPSIRPLTLLDLPIDLLREILDQFPDPAIRDGLINWRFVGMQRDRRRETRKTIQNLRLVCRVLNDLASPLLCPILQVNLDQTSLDRAVRLSHSPRVALGVRGISVGLQCFPGELASDLTRFKEFRLSQLQEVEDVCDWHLEGYQLALQDCASEGGGDEEPDGEYREALDNICRIRSSWGNYLDSGPNEVADEYQDILRTGFEKFGQSHRQQRQMLESQSFVRSLASCMVRMPNATALGFSDNNTAPIDFREPDLLLDNALLSQLMITSLSWSEIEHTDDIHIAPARILSELPIAIHNAGITLHDLYTGIFPCTRDQSLVSPEPKDPMLWSNLRAACQSLRRASFADCLNNLPIRHNHLGPTDRLHINEYLAALCCSPHLETVHITMRPFGLNDGQGKKGNYDLSPVLAAVKWPCIRNISILSVALDQAALDALCAGLGSFVERLHIADFELLEGSWVGALDILRQKTIPQATVYFPFSIGGEFGPRPHQTRQERLFASLQLPEWPPIFKQVEKYLSGADMNNPLRAE
ncbi:hypothetical protein FE257_007492 [Aspergillus nanangensis]|uniref:Uncharacterized protein n=1 Tax=Aspergillus nanangensis TaxID=2582783 RepID=A0AAD4CPL7_ASPNN|nr:hypothetical protein FE257_007492 [Aspergillus nanangensis]